MYTDLREIVTPGSRQDDEDDAAAAETLLAAYLTYVSTHGPEYLHTDGDVERCCNILLRSAFFRDNADELRRLMIQFESLDGSGPKGYVNLFLLLLDGRRNVRTLKQMRRAGLVELLAQLAKDNAQDAYRFTKLALAALYDMCRAQRLAADDLAAFDGEYIWFLLRLVELGHDEEDPYSYAVLKVLLAFNEQFMVAALPADSVEPFSRQSADSPRAATPGGGRSNPIVKVLSDHGARFKAYGENMIRMLNRERDTTLQLLILKQLFLLFTNEPTFEYFYTNDLYVLVDVFIRELNDLAEEHESLRHTFLRVLHPLLTNTQLRQPPHYKGQDLIKLLTDLNKECSHFGPVGSTTVRLLARCLTVPWLLPPRKRRLKIPRPSFNSHKSGTGNSQLGISLTGTDIASSASIRSFDSVNSIARSKAPAPPIPPTTEAAVSMVAAPAASPLTGIRSTAAPPAPARKHGKLLSRIGVVHVDRRCDTEQGQQSRAILDAKERDLAKEMDKLTVEVASD